VCNPMGRALHLVECGPRRIIERVNFDVYEGFTMIGEFA
jgi:hypothetical protein